MHSAGKTRTNNFSVLKSKSVCQGESSDFSVGFIFTADPSRKCSPCPHPIIAITQASDSLSAAENSNVFSFFVCVT